MNPALGPYAIAAGLLVLGGALKAVRPTDTAIALGRAGLPVASGVVRLGGAAEVVIGAVALAAASVVAAPLVATSYAAFFVFVANALVRHLPIASCGCFGKADTPPSRVHLGVNLGACVAALAMVIDPALAPFDVLIGERPGGVAFALLVVVGVGAVVGALTVLPGPRPGSRASDESGAASA